MKVHYSVGRDKLDKPMAIVGQSYPHSTAPVLSFYPDYRDAR